MTDASTLRLPSTHLALRSIGPWLSELLTPLPEAVATAARGRIELAVHELANNSIDHAKSSDLELSGSIEGDELVVVMVDSGLPFDGEQVSVPTEPQVRGYGLMIIEQVASVVDYSRHEDENRWTLRFSLDSGESRDN